MTENNKFSIYKVHHSGVNRGGGYDVPILLDGEEIGVLCLLKGVCKEVTSFTDHQLAAYKFDSGIDGPELMAREYNFKNDYVVVLNIFVNEYNDLKYSSPLWGDYCHVENFEDNLSLNIYDSLSEIKIDKNKHVRTTRHADSLAKSIVYTNPKDKFLFLYHCLELDFDYLILSKIKSISYENSTDLGLFVRNLNLADIDRIQMLIDGINISNIESCLMEIRNHVDVARKIFYDFGKDSNPIKDYSDFENFIIKAPTISQSEFLNMKKIYPTNLDFRRYDFLIKKCCCYWVYRIRCSIAHNKIGEFYIKNPDEINFVVKFGIPLIKKLIEYVVIRPDDAISSAIEGSTA